MIQFKMAIALTALAAAITCALAAKTDSAPATQPGLVAENARLQARVSELERQVQDETSKHRAAEKEIQNLKQLLGVVTKEQRELRARPSALDGIRMPPGSV